MSDRDFYDVLEVSRDAGQDEIKRSYRRLARANHPDANPDDPGAEARFKEIARAYETLSDPERRARYDRFGTDDANAVGGFGGGFGDLFDTLFGGGVFGGGRRGPAGPPRGPDLEAEVSLTLEEAVFGAEKPVTLRTAVGCEPCDGTGAAPDADVVTCPECGGAGQVRRVRQSMLGQMVTATVCPRCGGEGRTVSEPCPTCQGEGRTVEERTYTMDVPPGVDDGTTLRLGGRGAVGPRRGPAGDLYVHVRVQPHAHFERHGRDLVHRATLSIAQATLGCELAVPVLDPGAEPVALTVPRGTQPGHVFRLRGRGATLADGRGRGDLLVECVVGVPTELSRDEEAALRHFAELRGEVVAEHDPGLLSKLKSAFK